MRLTGQHMVLSSENLNNILEVLVRFQLFSFLNFASQN